MNNTTATPSSSSQTQALPHPKNSSLNNWRERLGHWLKRSWLGLASFGVLSLLSLGLLLGGLGLAWLMALLAPGTFEGLAESLIDRIPALIIATPLGIILGVIGVSLLLGTSLVLALLSWLAKRFGFSEKLRENLAGSTPSQGKG